MQAVRARRLVGGASAAALCSLVLTAQADPARASAAPEWSPADEARFEPHHARSFLEMGAGLALGTGGYWLLMRRNVADWDNPKPLSRFDGSAWVLDNNSIGVNFLGHPATGGLSYSFARANHQSVLGAFGYSFLTSFFWEFVIEFKEKVSVNDVVVTPGAGLPLGEFFYKLGLYLDTGHHDSLGMDVLRGVLGSGVALDRRLDQRAPPHVVTRDSLGFSANIWHDFEARYGVFELDTAGVSDFALYRAGVQGKLVTLTGYRALRSFGGGFCGAELSSFSLDVEASRYGWGLDVAGDTLLLGYHAQDFERAPGSRGIKGESVTLGSSLGYAYLRSSAHRYAAVERAVSLPEPDISYHAPNRREQFAALHLPGIAAEMSLLRPLYTWEAALRLQPSFGGVGAPAFYEWSAENLDERSKHILHRQGYFYGWGAALNVSTRLSLGPLRAGFDLVYAKYRSQDGLDRHAEQLTVDVPASGDVLRYGWSLGVSPPGSGVSVLLDWRLRRFHSEVGGFQLTARAVERGVTASWAF